MTCSKGTNRNVDNNKIEQIDYDKDEILRIVNKWTECHNNKNIDGFRDLYAYSIKYYQTLYTINKVIESKRKLLNKHKVFVQNVENIHVFFPSSDTAFVEFNKKVGIIPNSDDFNNYPSYLKLCKKPNGWRIIEESDYITDANLAKKKKQH